MDQPRRDADLLEKAPRQLAPGAHRGVQDLERDDPVMPEVARFVDGGHAPSADFLADLVAVGDGGAEARDQLGSEGHRSDSPSDSELLEMVIHVNGAEPAPVLA